MKTLAKVGLGCAGIIVFFITGVIVFGLIVYFNSNNWTAKSPERICKKVGFKLPPYTIIEEEDNMERDSSSWSWYYWKIKLKKPLSEKDIHQLENLAKNDPIWNGTRYDIFGYKNYKDSWEEGYDMDRDTFLSPKIYIEIYPMGNITIKYMWQDSFF